jgi:hypothetical protein
MPRSRMDSAAWWRGLTAHEGVDAQRPAPAQHPQLGFVQVEAQQVQRRGEQEEREEAELRPAPPLQRCRRDSAPRRRCCRGFSASPTTAATTSPARRRCRVVGERVDDGGRQAAGRARPWRTSRAAITSSRVLTVSSRSCSVRRRRAWPAAPAAGRGGGAAALRLATMALRSRRRVAQRQRHEALPRAGLEALQQVLVAGVVGDHQHEARRGACSSSPVRSSGSTRRSSASGCSTTVVSLRASTTSSR